jgi:predicted RNase H-related nuclease YkuK (DUF458 family)
MENIMQHLDVDKIKELLSTLNSDTKIYMGSDSYRFKVDGRWKARYTTVVVIHMNGKNGCQVFGRIDTEDDYDSNKKRPSLRLMNEVYRVSQLYLDLADVLEKYDVEVHLDINPSEKYGSSCVISQAMGYVKGVCNITPKVKPDAFAASFAADRFIAFTD